MNHVKISLPSATADDGKVILDGVDISSHLCGVRFNARVGDVTGLTLELAIPAVEVDGKVKPEVTLGQRDLLISLGWTPPPRVEIRSEDGPELDAPKAAGAIVLPDGALKVTVTEL